MYRIVLLLLIVLAFAAPAHADPWPANATIPSFIHLVGYGPAGPDSVSGHFTVTLRDLANNPMPGAEVVVDFTSATDLRIATDPMDPRLVVLPGGRRVMALTGQDGQASFTIVGGSYPRAGTPGPCTVQLYGAGTMLGSVPASVYDFNCTGGVAPNDMAWLAADYFAGTNPGRSDMDGNGVVSLSDLSRWATVYFSGRSVYSAASYSP